MKSIALIKYIPTTKEKSSHDTQQLGIICKNFPIQTNNNDYYNLVMNRSAKSVEYLYNNIYIY